MMNAKGILRKNEKGATAVFVALVLTMLLGFAALGVDVNYLYGVRNELHNAADAGALAGASVLFNDDGTLNRDAARAEALRIATSNKTGNQAVVVDLVDVIVDDVVVDDDKKYVLQTGHWSFTTKIFTANPATTQTEWKERTFSELDGDTNFINAVRVQADRSDTPSFFAKILGPKFQSFAVGADAVAYIGFAGTLYPEELDQPIALCRAAITDSKGTYSCDVGRMISDGTDTGGWSDLDTDACKGGANNNAVTPLICADGNIHKVTFNQTMGLMNGALGGTFTDFYDCWKENTAQKNNWNMTLPVVECSGSDGMKIDPCLPLVGAVNVNVIWVMDKQDSKYEEAPREMSVLDKDGSLIDSWSNPDPDGFTRWKSFVDHFNLQDINAIMIDDPKTTDIDETGMIDYAKMYRIKSVYFLPDCTVRPPAGNAGGENFGILAKIPVLVE